MKAQYSESEKWGRRAKFRGMCNEYDPVTDASRIAEAFGAQVQLDLDLEPRIKAFNKRYAPIVWRRDGELQATPMRWPFLPWFEDDPNIAYSTANCRSEDVERKPAFRHAWAGSQRCIVPAEAIYEPYWESFPPTGRQRVPQWKCTPMRFWRKDRRPFGIAGLWSHWRSKADPSVGLLTFTMLTVNADTHPIFKQMHRPDPKRPPNKQDKRMVVMLDESDYQTWLDAPLGEAKSFMTQYAADRIDYGPAAAPAADTSVDLFEA